MKRLLATVLLVAVAFRLSAAPYVIQLDDSTDPDAVARFHGLGMKHRWTHALKGFASDLNDNQVSRLNRDTRVKTVEPDVTVTMFSQVVPTGVQRIGTLSNSFAHILSNTNAVNADIAIIDTGIDLTHPDLNVSTNRQVTFVANTLTANDDNGHGSHCAGIAAAINNTIGVVGVAPGARLWAVKVLDASGSGALSQIISGVDWVTQNASQIQVASMSIGGQGDSSALRSAIQSSVGTGVVYVVAAGNSSFDIYGGDNVLGTSDDFFPASYPEVCTVSALADSDGIPGGLGIATSYGYDDTLATFSNYSINVDASNPITSPGKAIDVAAPGVNIYSTYKNNGYASLSGTSMACPHVAGAAALWIAQYGRATNAAQVYAIRQGLINSAEPQGAWGKNFTNPNWRLEKNPEGLVRVDTFPINPGLYPVVTITSPNTGNAIWGYKTTTSISFVGTASDPVAGDITSKLVWTAAISPTATALGSVTPVQIGTGGSFSASISSTGYCAIIASVTNAAGLKAVANAYLQISASTAPYTTAPVVTITAPTNGVTFAATNLVPFAATAVDAIDGNVASSLSWSSNLGGQLGTGSTFQGQLPIGTNVVTASVKNGGNLTGTASVTVYATGSLVVSNTPPLVYIAHPGAGLSVPQGTQVTANGVASDTEDGDLSSVITWRDSIDGYLGAGAGTSYTPSSMGTHTITAQVQDSGGLTASDTVDITVTTASPPPTAPLLAVALTTDSTSYINKQKATFKAVVTVSAAPIAGASVVFTLVTPKGHISYFNATTDSTGTATASWSVNTSSAGKGTATLTANASKTGYTANQSGLTFLLR
jgi:hypothetical protein